MTGEQRHAYAHGGPPAGRELRLAVLRDRRFRREVRHLHGARERDLGALLFEPAIREGELRTGGLGARHGRLHRRNPRPLERGRDDRGAVERQAEKRVELHACGGRGGLRCGELVLDQGERQL